jgi:hypothetical protein
MAKTPSRLATWFAGPPAAESGGFLTTHLRSTPHRDDRKIALNGFHVGFCRGLPRGTQMPLPIPGPSHEK